MGGIGGWWIPWACVLTGEVAASKYSLPAYKIPHGCSLTTGISGMFVTSQLQTSASDYIL